LAETPRNLCLNLGMPSALNFNQKILDMDVKIDPKKFRFYL